MSGSKKDPAGVGITGLVWLGCLFVAVAAAHKPADCFDSTSLLGHHASDGVLEFSDGKVTWRSCCGSVPAGRFFQLPDGRWVWVYTKEYKRKATNGSNVADFIVRPSVLGLRVVSGGATCGAAVAEGVSPGGAGGDFYRGLTGGLN